MISICIPVYNCDVRYLVKTLDSQCIKANIDYKIILIDDCSDNYFRNINKELSNIAQYIQLEKNIKWSKIRNLFLEYTNDEYLLFLDSDSEILKPDFIKNYINAIDEHTNIIVGGRIYSNKKPDKNKYLRWKYCTVREQKPATEVKSFEKRPFMSNNFLIRRNLFEKIKFDERLTGFGHEDTLFGFKLRKEGIAIKYINNPVLDSQLDTNEKFIIKTEQSIENLKLILNLLNYDKDFINEVKLLKTYFIIKSLKLDWFFQIVFTLFKKLIRKMLIKGIVNLKIFDLYKLGYLISIMKKF